MINPAKLLFNNNQLNDNFSQYGYVIIPILNDNDIYWLNEYWIKTKDITNFMPYSASLFSKDIKYRQEMSDAVTSIVAPQLTSVMPSATLVYAGFANKAPQEEAGVVPFHQDPSFVDESLYGAGNIWIPLVDMNESNGAIWVVPGSHRFNRGLRAFNQAFAYEAMEDELRLACARPLYPRAGEAIIFAHTLFHFSPPNRSDRPRLAAGGMVAESAAPLFYNYVDPADRTQVEVYEADKALFLEGPIGTRPHRPLAGRYPATAETITMEDVRHACTRL